MVSQSFRLNYEKDGEPWYPEAGRTAGEADAVLCGGIGILRTTIHLFYTGAHIVNGLVLLCVNNSGVIDGAIHECTGYLHYSS